MSNLTFLTEEQIFGKSCLEIFNKYGTECAITDFSILLGGYVSNFCYTSEGDSQENRTGWWWTKTPYGNNARVVDWPGLRRWSDVDRRAGGARPALPYSVIQSISSNRVRGTNGILEVEYGEYPQTIVPESLSNLLEQNFQYKTLTKTGKEYITDSVQCDCYSTSFQPRNHIEFSYKGKKFIRFVADLNCEDRNLSDGRQVKVGSPYWIEVEPIKWLISEKENIAVCKKIIFAGVQFNQEQNYKGNFENTNIYKFMDCYFSKNLESTKIATNVLETNSVIKKTNLQKLNPDKTEEAKRRRMTATERIQNWIEAGQSVLLRGPSGIGKTERIKTLYPNLIYIKLTNNMFPEKVVGSMNLQTGQNIPPDFYKQAMLDCATPEEQKLIKENVQNLYDLADKIYERSKESKGKIVILLDELLNVTPAVQSLVYTLVLNRLVEIGKGLKLPENVVVVATGNQKKYSIVAKDIAEPLEKRFDHIFDMEPKVGEWLYDYAIPNKIHPSVIGFIMSKYLSTGKSEEIKDMGYFYEEPEIGEMHPDKYGCNGRTNDPRGWVSISKTL